MSDPSIRPKAIRSPRGARVTEIDWADGHKSVYPHEILRGYCPCAGCQGHEGGIDFLPPSDNQQEIEDLVPVGNYALQVFWFDGHQSGLYSYRYLRMLCSCATCRPDATPRPSLPRA